MLLATGFLSYSGPFNQEFRTKLQKDWSKEMKTRKIPFTSGLNLIEMLVDNPQVRRFGLEIWMCSNTIGGKKQHSPNTEGLGSKEMKTRKIPFTSGLNLIGFWARNPGIKQRYLGKKKQQILYLCNVQFSTSLSSFMGPIFFHND